MVNMDLISIIVPVYNVENYLERCINSLINQSYSKIEIILVNDGSTDSSKEICNKYILQDSRVKLINKKNEGLGLARNTGLDYINGKYVTFIDSDDYADSNLIELLYKSIIDNGADTAIGGFKRVDDLENILYEEIYKLEVYSDEYVVKNLLSRMLGSCPEKSDAIRMSVWNVLYSSAIIKLNNIKFPSERKYISEDIMFNIDYYRYSKKSVTIESCAYNYRVNEKSLTRTYRKDRFEKCKFLYNEIVKKINKYNLNEDALLRAQRQYFVNLFTCIKQEDVIISKLKLKGAINNIKQICKDTQIQLIIREYPVEKLGIRQRAFIIMVKYKLATILYFTSKFRNI